MSRPSQVLKNILISSRRRLVQSKISIQNRVNYINSHNALEEYDLSDKNILILVVDCLRNDHVSPEYKRNTTPFLSQFQQQRAISAAPWTFASVPSLLTGLYPHNHGAVYRRELRNQKEGDPPRGVKSDISTLPEIVDAAGYKTFFSTSITTAEIPIRGRFQSVSVHHKADADTMVDEVLSWWRNHDQSPRFAYVQFGDLHTPLSEPPTQPFGEIADIDGLSRWRFEHTTEPEDEFERYRTERIRLYDTVLRFIDAEICRLYERLAERKDLEDTIIVITGDHGEEFWEREELERNHFHNPCNVYGAGHGHALVPEVLDVPLIIPKISLDANEISTVDIVPTLLSEIGYPANKLDHFDGKVLQNGSSEQPLLAEEIAYGYDQQAVITENFHLIYSPHEDEVVLLDRSQDELIDDEQRINELLQYTTFEKTYGEEVKIDTETEQRLADLGYLN